MPPRSDSRAPVDDLERGRARQVEGGRRQRPAGRSTIPGGPPSRPGSGSSRGRSGTASAGTRGRARDGRRRSVPDERVPADRDRAREVHVVGVVAVRGSPAAAPLRSGALAAAPARQISETIRRSVSTGRWGPWSSSVATGTRATAVLAGRPPTSGQVRRSYRNGPSSDHTGQVHLLVRESTQGLPVATHIRPRSRSQTIEKTIADASSGGPGPPLGLRRSPPAPRARRLSGGRHRHGRPGSRRWRPGWPGTAR